MILDEINIVSETLVIQYMVSFNTSNLAGKCIPNGFTEIDIWDYAIFLEQRRARMAEYIKNYYKSLI